MARVELARAHHQRRHLVAKATLSWPATMGFKPNDPAPMGWFADWKERPRSAAGPAPRAVAQSDARVTCFSAAVEATNTAQTVRRLRLFRSPAAAIRPSERLHAVPRFNFAAIPSHSSIAAQVRSSSTAMARNVGSIAGGSASAHARRRAAKLRDASERERQFARDARRVRRMTPEVRRRLQSLAPRPVVAQVT
jgi:hypothetical protein